MSLRSLVAAAADLVRAAVCPVPGPAFLYTGSRLGADLYPAVRDNAGGPMRTEARARVQESRAPRVTSPAPTPPTRPAPRTCAPTPDTTPAPGTRAGAAHDPRAWQAAPRARLADALPTVVTTQSPAPRHSPTCERLPGPITITDTGPGVPSVDALHGRALRRDAALHPRVDLPPAGTPRTLTLRANVAIPYGRPLTILRITDDLRVEMSGRNLVGAEHFFFVIDSWAYDDGELDVIVACERSHKRASGWIDTYGSYAC